MNINKYDNKVRTETWDYNPFTKEWESLESWACPRQMTSHWGCPSILERIIKNFGKPDVCFGKTDGLPEGVDTVDIDPNVNPTIVADWKHIPVKDGKWKYGFWDPPYDKRYEPELKEILRTLSNRIIILHQIMYPGTSLEGWKKFAIIGISTGPNMRMRALQVYDRTAIPLEQVLV